MHDTPTADRPPTAPGTGTGDDEAWRIRRTEADLDRLAETESIFALGLPANERVPERSDLVLAMQRCPGEFTADEKARNVAYYEARTVRDSSLSASPQAVLAAEVGHLDLAYDLFAESVLQDLADLGDKTGDGLHLASLAGAWLALVQGFGGLRDDRDVLSFDPRLPARIDRLGFCLRWHGHRLRVTLNRDEARYELPDADPETGIEVWHHGERLRVTGAGAVARPMPPVPDPGPEPPSPPGRRPTRRSAGER
ncbi:glycosyl hydrolase family 65 protein [Micromonospora sp. NPDC047620]|uniref:glycosyl hydrolase family 65 protein n=1 Tax=Micromonospora sp. NPDC047620 TaxID=3364251 RepID=UPI0037162690